MQPNRYPAKLLLTLPAGGQSGRAGNTCIKTETFRTGLLEHRL
jgi:hypothetical protein